MDCGGEAGQGQVTVSRQAGFALAALVEDWTKSLADKVGG